MSTKPCPHCGGEILETAKFCPLCGKRLPSTEETTRLNEETSFNPVSQPAEPVTQTPPVAPAPQQTTTPPKKNNSKIILLIILGILIAGGVGAGVYFLLVDKPSSSFFDDDDDFYDDDDDDDDDDRDDRYYNDTNVDTGYYIGNVEIEMLHHSDEESRSAALKPIVTDLTLLEGLQKAERVVYFF